MFALVICALRVLSVGAQPPTVRLIVAPGPVPVDQPFGIAVELSEGELTRLGPFPALPGFKKSTRDRRTTLRTVDGKTVTTLRITQRYLAFGEGEKALPGFSITVNNQVVRYSGGTVQIAPATGLAPSTATPAPPAATPATPPDGTVGYALADDLFGKPRPGDYRDVPDHARLYLSVIPRGSVWAGEGIRTRLYLTIAPEDQAVLSFAADFGRQIEELRRAVKPADVWEELPMAYPVVPDTVPGPDGTRRLRFQLHDAVYYPLSAAHPLRFPAVTLRLVKYRLAKKPIEGSENRLATDYVLRTQPLEVAVRPLPPHPLAGAVPVGELRWRDFLSRDPVRVNQSVRYWIEIDGTGNLAPVRFPEPLTVNSGGVAAYRPRVTITPAWPPIGAGGAGGRKRFEWELLANRPGTYRLDSLTQLIYFDPRRGRYDTLRSGLRWRVLANPVRRTVAPGEAPWAGDPFYERLDQEPVSFTPPPAPGILRFSANLVLGVLAAVGAGLWWRGRKK
ncbi:MAG: BatD family protein [Hymenobacteraceae bacterium]|nr:BatD family protein [Hymenobacteraceae bacterium]